MKRWMRRAACLYPRAWRAEYDAEFQALLEDVRPGWRAFLNVLGGAVRMQWSHGVLYWKLAAACGIAGLVLAAGMSFAMPGKYVSTATLRMEGADADYELKELEQSIFSHTNLISLMVDPQVDLYREERRAGQPLDELATRVRGDIQVQHSEQGGLTIAFAHLDKAKARLVVTKLARFFTMQNGARNMYHASVWRRYRPQSPMPPATIMETVQAATLPQSPLSPNRLAFAAYGLGGGLFLGLLAASAIRRTRRTLQTAAFAMAGAALALAASFLMPVTYTSRAELRIARPVVPMEASDPASIIERFHNMEKQVRSNLAALTRAPQIAMNHGERQKPLPMDAVIAKLRTRDLQIRLVDPPVGFTISFTGPDPVQDQYVVSWIAGNFQGVYDSSLGIRAAGWRDVAPTHVQYQTLDMATLPATPNFDWRLPMAAAGILLGLLASGLTMRGRTRLA